MERHFDGEFGLAFGYVENSVGYCLQWVVSRDYQSFAVLWRFDKHHVSADLKVWVIVLSLDFADTEGQVEIYYGDVKRKNLARGDVGNAHCRLADASRRYGQRTGVLVDFSLAYNVSVADFDAILAGAVSKRYLAGHALHYRVVLMWKAYGEDFGLVIVAIACGHADG